MNIYKKLDKTTSEKYTNAIAYWIATDMQPYRSVPKQGFKHLMYVICPGYTIPSRQVFADNKIPALYFEVKRRKNMNSTLHNFCRLHLIVGLPMPNSLTLA